MKYVILIYSNPATWEALPEAERNRECLRDGAPVVTDGPFSEAKEQLAGVWAVDVDSIERAVEIGAPVAEYDIVEVRPLMDFSGMEM